jgi:fibro-slime domain-containing protein
MIAAGLLAIASFSVQAATLPFNIIVRDFRGDTAATNPDFNNTLISGVKTGMVANTLDANGKPVYVGIGGGSNASGNVFSQDSFAAWYRSCNGSTYSCVSEQTVTLTANVDANDVLTYFNSAYFPLNSLTNPSIWDSSANNFFFTSELNLALIYDPTKENKFTFTGDDDVWVFINGQLVLDLGGIHAATTKSFDLDDLAAGLGISAYGQYSFKMFHAERHVTQSTLNITSTLGQPLNQVPEPETLALLGLGLLGMAGVRAKRKNVN